MTWAWRRATEADAGTVYDRIWPRGAAELAAYGRSRGDWLGACRALDAFAFTLVGKPQAILGVRRSDGRTLFQATRDANLVGLSRCMRRANPLIASELGVLVSDVRGLCVSADATKWYEFLGFVEDNAHAGHEYGGHKERRFVRVWNLSHV